MNPESALHSFHQMDFEWTAEELMDRREIRENVTEALASLPVSTLLDVDQISATLSQSVVRNPQTMPRQKL